MSRQTYILDIEVFPDLFFVGVHSYKENKDYSFEISYRKDERQSLFSFFKDFNGFLISFNGLHYDEVIIKYLLFENNELLRDNKTEFLRKIKSISDYVIKEDFSKISKYKFLKTNWISIDLFCYWSKGIRISKKISLKGLAIQLNWDELEELPFSPNHLFGNNEEEIERVIRYNLRNDLGVTKKLFEDMKGDIELRYYLLKEYGIICWSYDAPKIASEYLLDYYCKLTFEVDTPETFNEYKARIRKFRYENDKLKYGHLLPEVIFENKQLADIYQLYKNNEHSKLKNFIFTNNDTSFTIAPSIGGIHSVNDDTKYLPNDDEYIVDVDIASLYPTLFENYGFLRPELKIVLDKYVAMKYERIEAKRNKDKKKDTFLKLVLNSFSGLADSNSSWLYSPNEIVALRVTGQLIQMKLIDLLSKEKGIKVFFTNTDGTSCIIKKTQLDYLKQCMFEIEKLFKVKWEATINKQMVFINTNSYISEILEEFMLDENGNTINEYKYEKSKIKRKGGFFRHSSDIPLGDSTNFQVVAKALEKYFIEGIKPEDFIPFPKENNLTLYDYCGSRKVDKSWKVMYNNNIIQNFNRYFFSNKGHYILKINPETKKPHHLHADCVVTIVNKQDMKKDISDYDIKFKHYIKMTNKIIEKIEFKQLSLFD